MYVIKKVKLYKYKFMIRLKNMYYKLRLSLYKESNNSSVLNKEVREIKVIVSLTSFPERIHVVPWTILSILAQKHVKADKVILWLAESQFPNKEKDLPKKLLDLKSMGLEIEWCEDYRSYKKLIPCLINYPNNIIITADDDVFYNKCWIEYLYDAYKLDSRCIHCHRVTKFIPKPDGGFDAIPGGESFYKESSYLNKLVGVGGVLYPINSLDKEVLNVENFKALAPTNDDIWFWLMAVKNNVKINSISRRIPSPVAVLDARETSSLTSINDHGDNLFWRQFDNILRTYPEIVKKLK